MRSPKEIQGLVDEMLGIGVVCVMKGELQQAMVAGVLAAAFKWVLEQDSDFEKLVKGLERLKESRAN